MVVPAVPPLIKRSPEVRTYTMDFSRLPELVNGDTIDTITSLTPTEESLPDASVDLTLTDQTVAGSGQTVTFTASGGTSGLIYKITVVVVTVGGATLCGVGYLEVNDT